MLSAVDIMRMTPKQMALLTAMIAPFFASANLSHSVTLLKMLSSKSSFFYPFYKFSAEMNIMSAPYTSPE